jgi:hypothetical protein
MMFSLFKPFLLAVLSSTCCLSLAPHSFWVASTLTEQETTRHWSDGSTEIFRLVDTCDWGLMFPSVYSAWAGAALMSFSTKLILTVLTDNDVELGELSRGTSIILLIIYACCLILQFKTHSTLFTQGSDDTETAQSNGAIKMLRHLDSAN